MSRRLALVALVLAAVPVTGASAAPDAVKCAQQLAVSVALYDGPLSSYPGFAAGSANSFANCAT